MNGIIYIVKRLFHYVFFYHEETEGHEGVVALTIKFFTILFRIIDPRMLNPTPKRNELEKLILQILYKKISTPP